jgi:adenylate cyclase class 1
MDRVQAQRFFQTHNHERIQRLLQLAPARHSLILELLPFLFHLNAKLLPGYISDDTPAGLIDYRPTKSTLDQARQLERNFRYRQKALRRYPLRGLYLINPHGSLAYPDRPRFGLWLLYSNLLKENQRAQLQQKLEAIRHWAGENGIELDSRLISEAELARGVLSNWDRDQFYSAGLVLAGSQPYWWLTSPEEDLDYAGTINRMQSQRMLNPVSLVDFGAVGSFDADTLFHQSCDLLTESLHYGDELLSLAYLRHCLTEPQQSALSPLIKQQLYQQQHDSCRFDPQYLRLLRLQQQTDWSELQQHFYLNLPERLSKPVRQATLPWRRQFIEDLTREWCWDADKLKQLDQSLDDINHTETEFRNLGQFSAVMLSRLADFAREHRLDTDESLHKLKTLHRLRYAPAETQVSLLPPALRPEPGSERLYLNRFRDHHYWCLSRQPMDNPGASGLFQHEHLLQVLAYAVGNHLLSRSNWLSVNDQHGKVTTAVVVELCQRLFRSELVDLELNFAGISAAKDETLVTVSLFVNLEAEVSDKLSQQGLQLSSRLNDPLNYSSYHQSLVNSIDGLVFTSHGLCHSFRFSGSQAVLDFLQHILAWQPDQTTNWHSWCPTPIFGQTISLRMDDLLNQLIVHYQRFPDSGRLLLTMADRLFSLQWQQQHISLLKQPLSQDLWQILASQHRQFEAVRLDRYLDRDGLFNSLLQYQSPQRISVFIYLEKNTIICYLLDEFANLVKQQFQHLTEATLVAHLQVFLSEIRQRNTIAQLRFYHLSRQQQQWRALSVAVTRQASSYLPVKVSMQSAALDADCTIICGQQWFEGRADDPALFARVQQLVLSLRGRQSHYPVYLNSLHFADDLYHPAAVYMQHKQRLEQLFNPA